LRAPVSRTCSTECSGIIIHSAACGTGNGLFCALYTNHTNQRPGREPDKNLKDCTSRWKISSIAILPKRSTIGRHSTWTLAPPGSRIGKAAGLPCTMTRVKKQDFYELVERALEELPPELAELLDNVAIVVEDWPDYSTPLVGGEKNDVLYGLYEGVPLTQRSAGYYGFLPDKITIFRGPLERDFPQDELEEQVRITVVHEIAHHFGFGEDRIKELGWG
jgi:predicted Zn-dependent protease with MMP-like domain